MPWRGPLRTCPLCRSAAIRTIRRRELEQSGTRVVVQCGECEAWRGRDLGPRAVRALDRRLDRDREQMTRLVPEPDRASSDAEPQESERRQPP